MTIIADPNAEQRLLRDTLKRRIAHGWTRIWNEGWAEAVDDLMAPGYARNVRERTPMSRDDLKADRGVTAIVVS